MPQSDRKKDQVEVGRSDRGSSEGYKSVQTNFSESYSIFLYCSLMEVAYFSHLAVTRFPNFIVTFQSIACLIL